MTPKGRKKDGDWCGWIEEASTADGTIAAQACLV
jgi:hypothetical protein